MPNLSYETVTGPKTLAKRIGLGVAVLIVVIFVLVMSLFANELRTLASLAVVDQHPLLTMTYYGDYGFDEFLKVGAQSDRDVERFVIKRLLKGINIDLKISGAGCTVFAAQSETGERIFGRNFDFDYAPAMLLRTRPKNGYASLSMVNLSFAGFSADYLPQPKTLSSFLTLAAPYLPFEGMNEYGVTMALLAVPYAEPPQKPEQITLNTTTAIRLVLDKAANVEQAMDLLRSYNIYFSGDIECHYLLADKSGKTVLVEFMDGDVQFIEATKDYQVASNFIMFNGLNIGEGYSEFERYELIDQSLSHTGGIVDKAGAMNLLRDVQITDKTQWSAVYNHTTGEVAICMNMRYGQEYRFSLEMKK